MIYSISWWVLVHFRCLSVSRVHCFHFYQHMLFDVGYLSQLCQKFHSTKRSISLLQHLKMFCIDEWWSGANKTHDKLAVVAICCSFLWIVIFTVNCLLHTYIERWKKMWLDTRRKWLLYLRFEFDHAFKLVNVIFFHFVLLTNFDSVPTFQWGKGPKNHLAFSRVCCPLIANVNHKSHWSLVHLKYTRKNVCALRKKFQWWAENND